MNIQEMSLEEKILLLTGAEGNYINDLNGKLTKHVLADGPHGVKSPNDVIQKSTTLPCMQNLGNSWDTASAFLMGEVLGEDCLKNGIDILLAPSMNIKRTSVCGRNFEYISEDPILTGQLAKSYVLGLQSKGIAATIKHFCANNREYARFTVTSEVDERTLREVYLKPFEIALEAMPMSVMCSYNPLNGWYTSENKWLLETVLRKEFGFNGVIMSDWCAVHNRAKALKATLDLEMPFAERSKDNLLDAYNRGFVTIDEIDNSVNRILTMLEKIDNAKKVNKQVMSEEEKHHATIKIAEEGIVLLKNDNNILPLKNNGTSIAVIGEMAAKPEIGGGGSSNTELFSSYKQKNIKELLNEQLDKNKIVYSNGYNKVIYNTNREMMGKMAIKSAYENDIAIVCVGNNLSIESECYDRENIKIPYVHEQLLKQICEVNDNVIVIVTAGSCIDMSAWIDKVKAIIYTGFGGDGVNEALTNILTGKICPSGKLSETFIYRLEDNPVNTFKGNGFVEKYTDGIFVGYKYYEQNDIPVQFEFGFGLSYANFEYSNLIINKINETSFEVMYDITNRSDISAKEISQIYVKDVFAMVEQPKKALKDFSKDMFKPHETKTIKKILNKDAFSYYNVINHEWFIENGYFEIMIGSSSLDIKLKAKVEIILNDDEQNSKYDTLYNNMF